MHGTLQRLGAGVFDGGGGERLVARDEPVLGWPHLGQPGPLEPLHHHAHRPVAQLEHADDGAEGADLVQLVGVRLHHGAFRGLGAAHRLHHAE